MANQCTINSQITKLLHVSTLSCFPQGACNQYLAKLRKYRVIYKSLRDFQPLRYSSRFGHAEGEHVNRGRDTPSFCPTLQVLDMCTVGDATDVKFWQIPRHRPLTYYLSTPRFVTTAPLAVKPASTPRRLVQKKTWRDSLSVDMLLSAVSVLVVAQSSSEIPEGLMNNPVYIESKVFPLQA
jgi:hypothetical protein